jgi:exopolysaccharide biosynthesis polyprenyl glycosylphosphotransferase
MSTVASPVDPNAYAPALVERPARVTAAPLMPGAAAMALGDVVGVFASFGLVVAVANLEQLRQEAESFLGMRVTVRNVLLLVMLAVVWLLVFRALGLYDLRVTRRRAAEAGRIVAGVAAGTGLLHLMALTRADGGIPGAQLAGFAVTALVVSLGGREIRRSLEVTREGAGTRRVLMLGRNQRAHRMWHALATDGATRYELVGFLDSSGGTPPHPYMERLMLGSVDDLEAILMQQPVDEVCVALPIKSHYRSIQEALLVCERVGVRTRYAADMFTTQVAWPRYDTPGSPVVTLHVVPHDLRLGVKRLLDIVVAATLLLLLSPVLLLTALAIRIDSRGPVLFAQERYGLGRRRFRMFKFRTMVSDAEALQAALEAANEADGPVFKIARDPRVTRVGAFLRRTSIDELPQLLNVLRGEMSLVGPRPLPLRDVARFNRASDMRRFSIRPGITCLWQISGRSDISFDDWIRLDLKYIDEWSLWQDLRILAMTVPAVLRGTGAR